ncbi:SRPBCC domain-containing protein [Salinicoccus roseus]|uniref:SRPBCC domain-containing protein n=1 Tax=Salinicoccus roseus TaxID=45670 RepID=A0A0C2DLC5_9STAP|nr:SRPBCC domain-containing protein [Salinicoccus roseus]KIH70823.1 hypothetical protein SN16_06625 [Salinicoccus roseus]MDB0580469.1 SRPBCC domain-containing protein [Salinicoccus roseus]
MEIFYHKDADNAYQTIRTEIDATREQVFNYIGTTEGIRQWFPQLSFRQDGNSHQLLFDLGDGKYEEMDVLVHEAPERIRFTWDIGEVDMQLKSSGYYTELVFEEKLPYAFGLVAQDFTGWQFQVENIKHIAETGEPQPSEDHDFKAEEDKVAEALEQAGNGE